MPKELGKNVAYNFTIASGGSLAAPVSALDTIAGLDEFGDVADPVLASATQPSVGVKVLDRVNKAIYVWSLDRLHQQLQKMRNLTSFIDRPQYSQHFSSAQPFYDSPAPEYSFIGNALVSLAPLSRRLSSTSTVPIFCRYTAEAIGSCRVDIKIASVTPPPKSRNGSHVSTRASSPIGTNIQPGSKVNFFLSVDQVKGLGSNEFASIHLQIRLASITGPSTKSQVVYPSPTLIATPKILAYLREGHAPIEFFASLQATYLERMERWDEMREQHNIRAKPNGSAPTNSNPNLPTMRRSENDFVVEVTASGQRILLQISWSVDIDTCLDPVVFSRDMAVAIQARARDAGAPSRFASMFSSTKRLVKTSAIFSLKLTPPLTRSAKDLWRLDTSEKYVRATKKRSADVQAIKVILASSPPQPYSGGRPQQDILCDTLALWQRKFGHRGQIVLSQEPDEEDAIPAPALDPPVPLKLVAQTVTNPSRQALRLGASQDTR
ncbi:hypothetical protein M408DRAFT_28519 [Serendipita vermifera MAFF 305830]|uniref:Uncharacterized protein n=1 Tax=Serendipita vermifera MAFF 305830 TaxID=933852 RepID=A0A0C3ADH0_SERVB|nr:hypothetical protein M408DRAFT_28519 [Serendipita vermifera MAFF 305830]